VPNELLRQTGHANSVCSCHNANFRVSRLLSWLFVQRRGPMFAPYLDGDENHEWAWPEIESRVLSLDGDKHTELSIHNRGMASVLVINGGNGHYLVSARLGSHAGWINLFSEWPDPEEQVELIAGGQQVRGPKAMFASTVDVLRAAQVFAFDGRLRENLGWQTA
jgi:hypothetical protein